MVSPVTAEKPILQRVLRGGTRSLYNSLNTSVFRQSGRYLNKSKAIEIQLGQLVLPLIAGIALMYTQGREAMKPDGGDKKHWMRSLIEATGGFFLIDRFKGAFPLYALGVGAYRAGQQPDRLSKTQEVVKTAIIAMMGYVGVQMGAAWSEAADNIDEAELRKLLNSNPGLDKALAKISAPAAAGEKTAEALSDEAVVNLRNAVKTLRGNLNKLSTTTDAEARKALYESATAAKTGIMEQLRALEKHAPSGKGILGSLEETIGRHFGKKSVVPAKLADQLDLIGTAVRNSEEGYVKLVRRANPILGYLIMGSLVGIPLAKIANKWLEKRFPEWRQKPGPQFFNPYPKNPSAHHNNNGPSITIPGVGTYY